MSHYYSFGKKKGDFDVFKLFTYDDDGGSDFDFFRFGGVFGEFGDLFLNVEFGLELSCSLSEAVAHLSGARSSLVFV